MRATITAENLLQQNLNFIAECKKNRRDDFVTNLTALDENNNLIPMGNLKENEELIWSKDVQIGDEFRRTSSVTFYEADDVDVKNNQKRPAVVVIIKREISK